MAYGVRHIMQGRRNEVLQAREDSDSRILMNGLTMAAMATAITRAKPQFYRANMYCTTNTEAIAAKE